MSSVAAPLDHQHQSSSTMMNATLPPGPESVDDMMEMVSRSATTTKKRAAKQQQQPQQPSAEEIRQPSTKTNPTKTPLKTAKSKTIITENEDSVQQSPPPPLLVADSADPSISSTMPTSATTGKNNKTKTPSKTAPSSTSENATAAAQSPPTSTLKKSLSRKATDITIDNDGDNFENTNAGGDTTTNNNTLDLSDPCFSTAAFINLVFSRPPKDILVDMDNVESFFPKSNCIADESVFSPEELQENLRPLFKSPETAQRILEQKSLINDDNEATATTTVDPGEVLVYAAWLNKRGLVDEALNRGATLDYQDSTGRTALHYVSATGNASLMKRILKGLQKSVDSENNQRFVNGLNIKDNRGWTPLLISICKDLNSVAQLLLRLPECNIKTTLTHTCPPSRGRQAESSAIHFAAIRGNVALVKLLLGRGALVDERDSAHRMALHYAAANPRHTTPELIETLMTVNETIKSQLAIAPDIDGHSPLSLSISYANKTALEPLISSAAAFCTDSGGAILLSDHLVQRDAQGHHCLQLAYLRGHKSVLRMVEELYASLCNPQFEPPTLLEVLEQQLGESAQANMFDLLELSLQKISLETELNDVEMVTLTSLVNVLDEGHPEQRGQLVRAVKKAGAACCLKIMNETLKIEKAGGRLTGDGQRRKTPGGIFYQELKKELQQTINNEEAFRETWRFIYADQNERHRAHRKEVKKGVQQSSQSSAAAGDSSSSHNHSYAVGYEAAQSPPPKIINAGAQRSGAPQPPQRGTVGSRPATTIAPRPAGNAPVTRSFAASIGTRTTGGSPPTRPGTSAAVGGRPAVGTAASLSRSPGVLSPRTNPSNSTQQRVSPGGAGRSMNAVSQTAAKPAPRVNNFAQPTEALRSRLAHQPPPPPPAARQPQAAAVRKPPMQGSAAYAASRNVPATRNPAGTGSGKRRVEPPAADHYDEQDGDEPDEDGDEEEEGDDEEGDDVSDQEL